MNLSKKYKINISIDDVSPHPQSGIGVLDRCYELIDIFPKIKFTLFIPMYYTRQYQQSYPISYYPDFCETIKKLPSSNFEVGYHGYYHGILNVSSNDEFQYLTYEQAIDKFKKIQEERDKAGLSEIFKPIFRPPAWRMSSEAIRAAKDCKIEILALSPKDYAQQTYGNYSFPNIVYYNVNPPFDGLKLFENTEMVYHACEWDKNYLSQELTNDLKEFLLENKNEIEFCFIGGLV